MPGDDGIDGVAHGTPQDCQLREEQGAAAAQLEQHRRADQYDKTKETKQETGGLVAVEPLAGDEEVG